jgi:hypothetical protein
MQRNQSGEGTFRCATFSELRFHLPWANVGSNHISVISLVTSSDQTLQAFLIGSTELLLESFTILPPCSLSDNLRITWNMRN